MNRTWFGGFGLLAGAALSLLWLPGTSEAQIGFGIGRGGGVGFGVGRGGVGVSIGRPGGWGYGYSPGLYGYSAGYYTPGYNFLYNQQYGYANYPGYNYSYPGYLSGSRWGYGLQPYYSSSYPSYYGTYPIYAGSTAYVDSSPDYYAATPGVTGRQMFYGTAGGARGTDAHIQVEVPPDALVWFDNTLTQQRGRERLYQTPPLTPGREYTYTVTARWMENGEEVRRTRQITVEPGEVTTVDFTRPDREGPGQPPVGADRDLPGEPVPPRDDRPLDTAPPRGARPLDDAPGREVKPLDETPRRDAPPATPAPLEPRKKPGADKDRPAPVAPGTLDRLDTKPDTPPKRGDRPADVPPRTENDREPIDR